MQIKQTVRNLLLAAGIMCTVVALSATAAFAAPPSSPGNNGCGVDTAIIKCDPNTTTKGGTTGNGIWALLIIAINILSAGVGIAAVGGIVYGSILYTTAGGSSEQTKKAIDFIRNVVIGVIAYAVMFALLNFIIPGGLFD